MLRSTVASVIFCIFIGSVGFGVVPNPFTAQAADEVIDFQKAREIFQRRQRGEKISTEDAAYLEKALAARNRANKNNGGNPANSGGPSRAVSARESTGFKPLNEMNAEDKHQSEAPLLLWGPYLWADGMTPRAADKLSYRREDLASDGTHPSEAGRDKVARVMLEFFKTDALAKSWFVE